MRTGVKYIGVFMAESDVPSIMNQNTALSEVCLEVKNLKVLFHTPRGILRAVDDVSFTLSRGEILGLVGESGCGKTMTALSIMNLIPFPGKISGGKVLFMDKNLLDLTQDEMRLIRGQRISMVLQDPLGSFNPVYSIGNQLSEVVRKEKARKERYGKVVHALKQVRISNAEDRFHSYSFELSGGMNQRCAIAMALLPAPEIIIADEPTTALDVTIQLQVLALLKELNKSGRTAMIIITHDFGVVAVICTKVVVMYSGRIMESASTFTILKSPAHPYTKSLLASIPRIGGSKELHAIPGQPGASLDSVQGCLFASRCESVSPICREQTPPMKEVEKNHWVSCWKIESD